MTTQLNQAPASLPISAEDLALHCTAGQDFLDHARDCDASDEQCCMISHMLHQLKVKLIRDRWTAGLWLGLGLGLQRP